MPDIIVDVVTAERIVYSREVSMIIAPGVEGQLGILAHHAPLMTTLEAGEIRMKHDANEEDSLAISGGFLEVRPDRVIILADSAERAEEIDLARAEAARKRAEQRMKEKPAGYDADRCGLALRRALARLAVAEKRKKLRKI